MGRVPTSDCRHSSKKGFSETRFSYQINRAITEDILFALRGEGWQCFVAFEPDEPYLLDLLPHLDGGRALIFGSDFPHPDHESDIVEGSR